MQRLLYIFILSVLICQGLCAETSGGEPDQVSVLVYRRSAKKKHNPKVVTVVVTATPPPSGTPPLTAVSSIPTARPIGEASPQMTQPASAIPAPPPSAPAQGSSDSVSLPTQSSSSSIVSIPQQTGSPSTGRNRPEPGLIAPARATPLALGMRPTAELLSSNPEAVFNGEDRLSRINHGLTVIASLLTIFLL